MELDKAIQSRKSVKKYSSKKPDWRDIIECIDACRFTPMAGNIYSLKFIIVSNKTKINKLAEASQQDFISNAQYVVVVCSETLKTLNSYEKRGEIYLRQQAGAAIQNFLLSVEQKGLSTCWVGHFIEYLIKETLKIPEGVNVEAIFPIGYELKMKGVQTRKKTKIDLDKVLYFEKYKEKQMKKKQSIDV